ncbi:hypothetical protein WICPIJ_007480 [Wickerhamomyces pijperi]|uniref:Uncharacterized protein n=1 Tax=Wickerhamomyces pijperi TaxID=599730 RepID=A0A9P8TKF8_WICPI|nr:hypothetical protein WICPIJ_007480 [Wickerhamomyces pijperi]
MPDTQILLTRNQKVLIQLSRIILTEDNIIRLSAKISKSLSESITEYLRKKSASTSDTLVFNFLIPTLRKLLRYNSLSVAILILFKLMKKSEKLNIKQMMKSYSLPIINALTLIPLISNILNISLTPKGDNFQASTVMIRILTALTVFSKTNVSSKLPTKVKIYLTFYVLLSLVQSQLSSLLSGGQDLQSRYQNTTTFKWVRRLSLVVILTNFYTDYESKPQLVEHSMVLKLIKLLDNYPNSQPLRISGVGLRWLSLSVITFGVSLIIRVYNHHRHSDSTSAKAISFSQLMRQLVNSSLSTSTILISTFSMLKLLTKHQSFYKTKDNKLKIILLLAKFITMFPLSSLLLSDHSASGFIRSYLLKNFLLMKFTELISNGKSNVIQLDKLMEWSLSFGVIGIGSISTIDHGSKDLKKLYGLFML